MDDFRDGRKSFFRDIDDFMDDDFMGFGEEFRRIREQMDRMMRDVMSHDHPGDEPGKSYVYGFRMHTGPDGKPLVEEFGNVPKPGVHEIPGGREPLVDVIAGKEEITVIAELPGVDKKDIDLKADERGLQILVDNPGRRYHKELKMPSEVDPDTIKASYKNGILEVKLKRRRQKTEDKKKIRID